jgi:formate dehydrogenase subunit beta
MNTGDLFIGVSQDSKIMGEGENGGVVTAILRFALQKKIVDRVFAVKAGKNRYEAILSCITDPEKLIECSGSLHFATPPIAKYIKNYVKRE